MFQMFIILLGCLEVYKTGGWSYQKVTVYFYIVCIGIPELFNIAQNVVGEEKKK